MAGAQKQADSEVLNINRALTDFSSLVTLPTNRSITINGREYFGLGLSPRDNKEVAANISANYGPTLNKMKEIATDAAQFCAMADILYSHIRIKEDILAIPTAQMDDETKMMLIKALAQTWKNLQTDVNAGNVDIVAKYGPIYGDYRVKLDASDYAGLDAACTAAFGETRDVKIYESVLSSRPIKQQTTNVQVPAPVEDQHLAPTGEEQGAGPITAFPPDAIPFIYSYRTGNQTGPITFEIHVRDADGTEINVVDANGAKQLAGFYQFSAEDLANLRRFAAGLPDTATIVYLPGEDKYQFSYDNKIFKLPAALVAVVLAAKNVKPSEFNAMPDAEKTGFFKASVTELLRIGAEETDQIQDGLSAAAANVTKPKKKWFEKVMDFLKLILSLAALYFSIQGLFTLISGKKNDQAELNEFLTKTRAFESLMYGMNAGYDSVRRQATDLFAPPDNSVPDNPPMGG